MDKRLPHRIREVRLQFQSEGKSCTADSVKDEICKKFSEYGRIKQQALKRLVSQELSTPLPSAAESSAGGQQRASDEPAPQKKRKKAASTQEQGQETSAFKGQATAEKENMNGSLRKMYSQGSEAGSAAAANLVAKAGKLEGGDGSDVVNRARRAREKAAMAAARREQGLPDPESSKGFQPEERPEERLEDLGGVDDILTDLRQLVVQPLGHPEVFAHLGVQPPTGVLLYGPPGCGKTKIANAIAGTTGVPFFRIAATEIVSGMSGESEKKIRELFQAAIAAAPSLIFMDEVDSITPKRDSAGREMERRIVAQLLTCLDELQKTNVIVLGATNRPDSLDPALRRAGRFDREIAMGIPDEAARAKILAKMVEGMRLAEDLDLKFLAKKTAGFVGADLSALTKEAALIAIQRGFEGLSAQRQTDAPEEGRPEPYSAEEMANLAVDMNDFSAALTKVQPSSLREGFATIPDVKWEDVGALQEVQSDMEAAVCEPIRKAELFRELGLTVPVGVLLFGPPGCGKTLLAKATANASGANFIAVKGPELLNKYVGESERAVRLCFQRARSSSPCVIFFDELDALVPRRSAEGSGSSERVVNQMLTEMDGVQSRSQVYIVAATNRPDIIDPAMLRPGRLDRLLFVPLPSQAGRLEILQAHLRKMPLAEDVDLEKMAREAEGFSGADLSSLAREAAMLAIRAAADRLPSALQDAGQEKQSLAAAAGVQVTSALLQQARSRTVPSVSQKERNEYKALAARLCGWKTKAETVEATAEKPVEGQDEPKTS
mmetsp:Transcript_2361/g.4270  ORF Transcript_2361/g.4270 Transcript_2361/m.4270 type:complete len:778 (+) Transcript_2361:37-2370(+)